MYKNLIYSFLIAAVTMSCNPSVDEKDKDLKTETNDLTKKDIPVFNEDTAYYFVEKQVLFGPRVPNTKSHQDCALFFEEKLSEYADTVILQKTRVRAYDGTALNLVNIIASFNPQTNNRIFLCAHWDSRHIAEKDPDPLLQKKPIDGANDGASGVGVLLEIARLLKIHNAPVGIDIILFDGEDYGQPDNSNLPQKPDTWALGSQYWSRKPHKQNYYAKYGILLDMVGTKDATFLKEGYSIKYAPDVVKKVWNTAQKLGYTNFFLNKETNSITDDHYYINTIIGIPTIDIIHYDNTTATGFFPQWHTHGDNMDQISKETLKAVGQTLITVIFEEK